MRRATYDAFNRVGSGDPALLTSAGLWFDAVLRRRVTSRRRHPGEGVEARVEGGQTVFVVFTRGFDGPLVRTEIRCS